MSSILRILTVSNVIVIILLLIMAGVRMLGFAMKFSFDIQIIILAILIGIVTKMLNGRFRDGLCVLVIDFLAICLTL